MVAKDLQRNVLRVAQGGDHPLLLAAALVAGQAHWINAAPAAIHSEAGYRCYAKTRYRQPDQACRVFAGSGGTCLTVRFDSPQRAITPGQSVVFYDADACLGGAVIEGVTD